MVSTTTRTPLSDGSVVIRRVASMPSSLGMRMSINTTSGRWRTGHRHGLLTVFCLADQREVGGVLDHRPQSGADQRLVIGNADAHGHVDSANGKRAAT